MALNLFAKSVFAGEFPLTAEFRSGPRNDKKSYQIWKDAQMLPEGYPVDLQTNVLRFSSNNFEYANRFAGENPNMLILSTWRAASGQPKDSRIAENSDPLGSSVISFPGHFVVSPGSNLIRGITSTSGVLYVESNDDMIIGPALLVETESTGAKRWDKYEYVLITKVKGNAITIRRQWNDSPEALAFPVGSYLAPMPWDTRNNDPYVDFFFNLSDLCPRDEEGKTAMDVLLEEMLYPLAAGGPLENIGGLDLASGPLTVNPMNADYNVDGIADPDSVYREGVGTFYERVRAVLGPSRVITTSPDYEFIGFINGVNQEGLANPDDPVQWEEISRTVNDMQAWQRLSTLPIASIVFSQYYDRADEPIRMQLQRMLNGYAVCLGMAADIETGTGEVMDAIQRIELFKGDEREAHWLGRALGVQRPATMTPSLLNGASSQHDWEKILPAISVLRGTLSVDGDELVLSPWDRPFPGFVTLYLNFELDEKSDFTVFFEALSDDDTTYRKIFLPRVSVPFETGPVRATLSNKDYLPVSFHVRGARSGQVKMDFRFGQGGDIRFRKMSVHKSPDTFACEFERGVVLVNPSLRQSTFDLTEIFPDRRDYSRLATTPPQGEIPARYRDQFLQALDINNGRPIDRPHDVVVGQRNALFLIANDVTAPPAPTVDPWRGAGGPPVASPTPSPTAAAADSNDTEGRFEVRPGAWVSCEWASRRSEKTRRRCSKIAADGRLVSEICPMACDAD